jgi:hypothetical protein
VLDAVPLTAVPLGRHGKAGDDDQPPNVRRVVLHMATAVTVSTVRKPCEGRVFDPITV